VGAGVLGAAVTMGAFFLPGMRDSEHVGEGPSDLVDALPIAELKAS
jgi:hypothetical protein